MGYPLPSFGKESIQTKQNLISEYSKDMNRHRNPTAKKTFHPSYYIISIEIIGRTSFFLLTSILNLALPLPSFFKVLPFISLFYCLDEQRQ